MLPDISSSGVVEYPADNDNFTLLTPFLLVIFHLSQLFYLSLELPSSIFGTRLCSCCVQYRLSLP